MENQNLEIKKYILTYGSLLGGISVVFGLMLFFFDMHYQQETSVNVVNSLISISVIGVAQFAYRKDNEGFMSLGQGIKIGLGTSVISGVMGVVYFLILSNILDPEMMNKALEMGMNQFMDQNPEASEEMIDQVKSMQGKFTGPVITSSFILIFSLFFGLIFSLITGLILKRNRPE